MTQFNYAQGSCISFGDLNRTLAQAHREQVRLGLSRSRRTRPLWQRLRERVFGAVI